MMYSHSEILDQSMSFETSGKMRVMAAFVRFWQERKKRRLLKSFDEVEPGVFVLKQEIIDRAKAKAGKIKIIKIKK